MLEKTLYTIHYDPADETGILIWHTYVTSKEFRGGLQDFIDYVAERPLRKVIRHTKYLGIISVEDQEWYIQKILPKLKKMGLQYSAIVTPRNKLAQLSIEDLVDKIADKELVIRYFVKMEDAVEWLKDK